ncbi:nitrogenase component 1, partial [Methanocaldococcus infernus]
MASENFKITPYKVTLKKDGLPRCGTRSTPGVITQRSCVYYGARWILAPIKNSIHIIHSPIGCAYYGATVRKKTYTIASSDISEIEIIYGGEKKLKKAILEAARELKGEVIFVYLTCPTALNGDNIEAVCREAEEILKIPVIPVYSPGFAGCSQAKGHEIGMKALFRLIDRNVDSAKELIKKKRRYKFYKISKDEELTVNIIGEFNVSHDLEVIKELLSKLGIRVICTFTGDCDLKSISESKKAKLNLVHCRSTGKYIANYMEEKYGIPQMKVSFFGISNTQKSLLEIGKFFNIEERAVEVIKEEYNKIKEELKFYLEKLEGKKVGMFMGGSKIGLLSAAFRDIGMEPIIIGSQFGSLEDYLEAYINAEDNTILVDDASNVDLQIMMENKKPDIFIGGTKEKFLALKLGIPFLSFPQDNYPFTGF